MKRFWIFFSGVLIYASALLVILVGKTNVVFYFGSSSDTFIFSLSQKQTTGLNFHNSNKNFIELFRNFQIQNPIGFTDEKRNKKLILVLTTESWFSTSKMNKYLLRCVYNNCELTENQSFLSTADGIIFHLPYGKFALENPPIKSTDRRTDQPWIAMHFESPSNIDAKQLFSNRWKYTFNWSMSYRFDADIQIPYGAIKRRTDPILKDYHKIVARKTKMAVWFVSNCHPESKREVIVHLLQKDGIDIDIYGKCGRGRIDDEHTLSKYKFYIAFENSLCEDYVTEKFFSRYNFDVILVTYGGADYSRLLPTGTFINVADFRNTKHLARYLRALASDDNRYVRMLEAKDKYISLGPDPFGFRYGMCKLCNKINNVDINRHIYDDNSEFLHHSQCRVPERVKRGYILV